MYAKIYFIMQQNERIKLINYIHISISAYISFYSLEIIFEMNKIINMNDKRKEFLLWGKKKDKNI